MTCPICDSTDTGVFKEKIKDHYDLVACNNCHAIFAAPFAAPDMSFYTEATDVSSQERHTILFPFPKSHPARKSAVLANGQGKNLLDIGCGNGSFASFAEEQGFTVTGIDIDKSSLSVAGKRNLKRTSFLDTTLRTFAADTANHNSFDIISMFEVFEHLDNPNETIGLLKKLLKPEGYFIGSLPNIERWKMWQYNMNYELPPYHLTYWTTKTWQAYVSRMGFKPISVSTDIYHGYISDVMRFRRSVSPGSLANTYFAVVKKFIETPFEKMINKGASFFFVLQNRE